MQTLRTAILNSWQTVCAHVASGQVQQFTGQDKEKKVLRRLKQEILKSYPNVQVIGPDNQTSFGSWEIDIVCSHGAERIAIEGKYKVLSDGAVPDNRKEAFFDLYKLEQYVAGGGYTNGIFLWLTNQPRYLQVATGDSLNFSTHQGRIYQSGTPLTANRARRSMPLPLSLKGNYVFKWQTIAPSAVWHTLILET